MQASLRTASLLVTAALLLSACGGGGGGNPTPSNPTPTPNVSVDCPTSGPSPTSLERAPATHLRRAVAVGERAAYVPGALAIQYAASADAHPIDAAASRLGALHVSDIEYRAIGLRSRIVNVDPSRVDQAIAQIKALPGVKSVTRVAYRRRMAVTADDPYYVGASGTSAPYYQTASTFGQWDMHAINVAGGWSLFGSALTAAPIAVIDTGVDVTLAEMGGGKITRTQCFVTYPSGTAQTTSQFVIDTDGHGTNVAGIADTDTDNAFGFAGAAFDSPLMAYRIFPSDPSNGCEGSNPPAQCNSDTADEASAISDAVQHGAKVINLSLGGSPPCDTSDPEYTAVENAISSGVVVVAAAGNGNSSGVGQPQLDCPAADPGVIAVGASALDDSGSSIDEYVASYSNYLSSTGTSNGGAFLVAPGGDPSSSADDDNLHWIQNIYSTTAYDASSNPSCTGNDDYGETGDCNVLIAGTSQATPHVAGVAALILAARSTYTPAQVATALCKGADDIGDSKEGCGRVDARGAVSYAQSH